MLAKAWLSSLGKEIGTFKKLSNIAFIESRPSINLHVQIDESFIDNKDDYSGTRKEQQLTATFLNSEVSELFQNEVLVIGDDKYNLKTVFNRDEISVSYIVLLL